MIVEANSVLMAGRQGASAANAASKMAGDVVSGGSGTAVMPIKKRKYEKRGSIEASRASVEFQRPAAPPRLGPGRASIEAARNSMDRASFDSRRPSFDRRPSLEFRVSLDRRRGSLEVQACPVKRPADNGQTATIEEVRDDMEMSPIAENSDELLEADDDAGDDSESNAVIQTRLLSKIFSLAGGSSKPSCVKVKGAEGDGFIVNKRFMDVVKRRQQRQQTELEQLRQQNAALREANKNLSGQYMSMANWQQFTTPAAQQQMYPQSYVYSSLYAAEHQQQAVQRPAPMPAMPWQQ